MSFDDQAASIPSQGTTRTSTTRTEHSGSSSGSRNLLRKRSGDQVVVFVRASDEICLKDREEVEHACTDKSPLAIEKLPRFSWKGYKPIYLPSGGKHREYAGAIELDSLSTFFKLRRLTGNVNKLYIFENSPTEHRPLYGAAPAA